MKRYLIDLNIDSNLSRGDGRDGETGVGLGNNGEADKNGRFQINLSLGKAYEYDVVESLTHEFFIHALRNANDIVDDGARNYSNIDKNIKNSISRGSYHHFQENFDARSNKSQFGNQGYKILQQANKKYEKYNTNSDIWSSMWGFIY